MADISIYMDKIRKYVEKTPASKYALMLEEKTKVNYEYFIAGFGVLLVLCIFFGIGAGFITTVIGFVYPFYKSILSLESKDSEQTTKWLIYWILYSTITVLEEYAALVIYWIPFYYPLKASFLVYIMVPQFTGAQYVYYVIKPYFSGIIGDKIDASLSSAGSKEE